MSLSSRHIAGRLSRMTYCRRGFTLLEVLAATALMGTLALSIYSTLHIAFRAHRTAENALQPTRALAHSLDMVAQELRATVPVTGLLAVEFFGTEESILFYNTKPYAPWPHHSAGFREIEIALDEESLAGERVLVKRTRDKPMAPVRIEPDAIILCRSVQTFTVRYYDGATWLEEWDSAARGDAVPEAVELTLTLEPLNPDDPAARGPTLSRIVNLPVSGQTFAQRGGQVTNRP